MISHSKICVRDDLWEYKTWYGTYDSDLQLFNVVLHYKYFDWIILQFCKSTFERWYQILKSVQGTTYGIKTIFMGHKNLNFIFKILYFENKIYITYYLFWYKTLIILKWDIYDPNITLKMLCFVLKYFLWDILCCISTNQYVIWDF